MASVSVYGPNWSAYTRTVRLVLTEKEVEYDLKEVDFSSGVMPPDHFNFHPFGKVPVLEHGSYIIYETGPICRYVDNAFNGPALQPSDAMQLGRMAQLVAIVDTYLSTDIRMGFVNELLFKPMVDLVPDKERVEKARESISKGFDAIGNLVANTNYLVGQKITLADLHIAPLIYYLDKTPGGNDLISGQPKLANWWETIKSRRSIAMTEPDLRVFYSD